MKKATTKRALFLSFVSMFLCFTMLLGTTYAWFTDSVTSDVNTIVAGNLDVELYNGLEVDEQTKVNENTDLFDGIALWEPGAAIYENFTVANEGNLALKYQLAVKISDNTGAKNLADVLKVGVVADGIVDGTSREDAIKAVTEWMPFESFVKSGKLEASTTTEPTTDTYGVVVYWQPSDNDNEYNMNNGKTADDQLKINILVDLFATQVEAEMDSFGKDYDAGTPMPTIPVDRPNSGDVVLTGNKENAITVVIPASVADQLPAGVTSLGLSVSTPVVDTTTNTITYESIEVVDQDGNVIDLANYTGAEDVTIVLPAQTTFVADELVAIYHDDELVATAVVDANGVISYDVAHLCEVKVGALVAPTVTEDGTIEISSAEELYYFANSVNAGDSYAGKTVVLTADIDLNNAKWTPIGSFDYDRDAQKYANIVAFKGTFDGKGYTISNLKVYTPETESAGLFASVEAATIKNLTVKNVDIVAGSHAGAIVGRAHTYGKLTTIDNCHVTGDINILIDWAYAGAIIGKASTLNINNCSVVPNGTGVITAANRNAVGSLVGWVEQPSTFTTCKAENMTLTGWANIGGITGFIGSGSTIDGCSATNMVLTKTREDGHPTIGYIAGGYNGQNMTIKNSVANNISLNGTAVSVKSADTMYGADFYGNVDAIGPAVSNIESSNLVNNLIYVSEVKTVDDLKAAFANGGNYVLKSDITVTEALTVRNGTDVVLYMNGKVISGTCNAGQGYLIMVNNGASLTINDNSAAQTGKITFAKGTSDTGWVIDLEGKLVLNSGTIELTGSDWFIGYAVDVRPNAWGTNYTEPTVFTMNGGKLVSSDGAVRVASSSADNYGNIVASFVMNGGEIEAAWDGIFVQQSNTAYDTLNVELNGGKITSALSPIRVYGPIATSVNSGSAKPMTITIGDAELAISGEMDTTRTWYIDGKIVLGGGLDVATLENYSTITIK